MKAIIPCDLRRAFLQRLGCTSRMWQQVHPMSHYQHVVLDDTLYVWRILGGIAKLVFIIGFQAAGQESIFTISKWIPMPTCPGRHRLSNWSHWAGTNRRQYWQAGNQLPSKYCIDSCQILVKTSRSQVEPVITDDNGTDLCRSLKSLEILAISG